MKMFVCHGGWLLGLLLAGCAAAPDKTDHFNPPVTAASPLANLMIISATYGSGTQFADVTTRVNGLLSQPDVEFFARPEWLHADPTPGWNKTLVIIYEYKGVRHLFTTGEGGRVTAKLLARDARKKD